MVLPTPCEREVIMKCPNSITYMTPDEVAECISLSDDTYGVLWKLLSETPKSERKPLGGDGTNGTVEYPPEPDVGKRMNDYWQMLTRTQQEEIITACKKEDNNDFESELFD